MTSAPLLAPSPIPDPAARETPKEIEAHEIEALIEQYGLASANVLAAGWDGVEIFAAQGYGLSQFLSPHTNRRADSYGGGFENRRRLLGRVIARVRETVGPAFLVGVRINGDDFVAGGLTVDDACQTAILSQVLAAQLDIVLIWLPKQCSELNAMDQLWKELKGDLAANRQFKNIAEAVDYAEQWVLNLTDNQALQKAGVFSKSYWLRHF
ncbi:MAG: transposase [Blastocatellia bacterium]